MHVAVIDVGKPNKNLGWAIIGPAPSDGTDLDVCIRNIAAALEKGPVALGFEAPMYVPLRKKPADLTKARAGECRDGVNRPYSASAGSTVLVTATVVASYVLAELRALAAAETATMDWKTYLAHPRGLLLFEAFVTNQRKTTNTRHVEDALLAASYLHSAIMHGQPISSAIHEPNCLSLLGAMLLRTGWTNDPHILSEECLVVRP